MRVAVIVRSLKIGGMERVAVNLSESFTDNGHEAHLIYFKDKDRAFTPKNNVHLHLFDLEKILITSVIGIPFYLFAKFFNILFRRTYFFWQGIFLSPIFKYKIKKLEKQYGKFDLIIMRGHGTFEALWSLKDNRIVQMIESVFIPHKTTRDKFYLKCLYSGKNLAGVSFGVEEKLTKVVNDLNLRPKNITTINNPIDTNIINNKIKEYIPNIQKPYIVSVGRITPNKNLSLLIQAFIYARKNLNLQHQLVIIGDGPEYIKIQQLAKNSNFSDDIKFLGLLNNPFPWVKNADLFALTSQAEGLPTVLLEALACNTDIVAAKGQGGIKDIMTDELKNHLCSFDKVDYANKIVEILNKKDKIDTNKFLNIYLPKTIVDKYISTYIS